MFLMARIYTSSFAHSVSLRNFYYIVLFIRILHNYFLTAETLRRRDAEK